MSDELSWKQFAIVFAMSRGLVMVLLLIIMEFVSFMDLPLLIFLIFPHTSCGCACVVIVDMYLDHDSFLLFNIVLRNMACVLFRFIKFSVELHFRNWYSDFLLFFIADSQSLFHQGTVFLVWLIFLAPNVVVAALVMDLVSSMIWLCMLSLRFIFLVSICAAKSSHFVWSTSTWRK